MRALVVGLGGIGQRHARNLRALLGKDVEIDAYRVRRQTPVLSSKLEAVEGADLEAAYDLRSFDSLEQALAQRPSMAFICNPSSLHLEVAMAAAEAGCHLFIEKPLSAAWAGVDALAHLVEQRRLVALVGYQMRFHPCLRQLRALLQQRRIGSVLAVSAEIGEYLPGWHPYEDYRAMYASKRALGGGVVLSQIHEFDYLYWLFGLPRRVFALGGHLSNLEIDVEDVASVLMECVVDGRPVPVHLHQDYLQRPPARTCKVVGDRGTLVVDFVALTVEVFEGAKQPAESFAFAGFERNQMFLDEIRHFLACVRGEEQPLVPVREGAQSLRMALAARESMETGRAVQLA
jgi:predicted dehydrogenase